MLYGIQISQILKQLNNILAILLRKFKAQGHIRLRLKDGTGIYVLARANYLLKLRILL